MNFFFKEPKQFNDFLHHLVKFCQEKDLKRFGEYLASLEITLISKKEAPDSESPRMMPEALLLKGSQKPSKDCEN
ncbi:ATP-dependent DNA helicase 2 subunit KU80-like [Olea europaea var. sylvestris]|uniref:ATP-dependent DNA helicase 2 subunit KU80-like n=1 Tax=Olea europaea var. sylvestris TaxID=158386 RepID=UPI000C1CF11A|nr:ATP-dependent DNA helicase 2 subunit KU80-like [Olea europaea var. sylvestris]